jgi:hypothetical protein
MKLSLATLVLVLGCLPACTTAALSPAGADVAPTRDPLPPECETVGLLVGKGGGTFGGAYLPNDALIEYAMNDIRNKAADLGATHIRHDPPQLGMGDGTTTSVTITGTAYSCPTSVPRSM